MSPFPLPAFPSIGHSMSLEVSIDQDDVVTGWIRFYLGGVGKP
jgi:hypothetical protein